MTTIERAVGERPAAGAEVGRLSWWGPALSLVAVAWGGNQFTPMLAAYEAQRGFTTLEVNTLLAAYVVGIIPALASAAPAIRTAGHRAVMIAGVVLSLVGSLLLVVGSASFVALLAGRMLTGLGLGWGMVAGGAWMLALGSRCGWPSGRAVLRAALSLTAGFGLGPTITGMWGQFGADPLRWAYVPHLVFTVAALALGTRTPAGVRLDQPGPQQAPPLSARGGNARALWRIAGVAPWIFGALGMAYAVLPQQIYGQLGDRRTLYLAVLCLTSLGAGFLTQRLAAGLVRPSIRTSYAGAGLFAVVTAAAAAGFAWLSPVVVWVGAVLYGVAYGLILIGCLAEVETTVAPAHQARANALTYSLAYLGFAVPVVLTWLTRRGFAMENLLWAVVAAAALLWLGTGLIGSLTTRSAPAAAPPRRSMT